MIRVWLNLKQWDHFVQESYAIATILKKINLRGLCENVSMFCSCELVSEISAIHRGGSAERYAESQEIGRAPRRASWVSLRHIDAIPLMIAWNEYHREGCVIEYQRMIRHDYHWVLVVVSFIATKYHDCFQGGIQLCWATAAITGVLILVALAHFGISRSTFLTNLFHASFGVIRQVDEDFTSL